MFLFHYYCFIGIVGNERDPAPLIPATFPNWAAYKSFIRDNNKVTWCNFNVEPMPNPNGDMELPFLATGAELDGVAAPQPESLGSGASHTTRVIETSSGSSRPSASRSVPCSKRSPPSGHWDGSAARIVLVVSSAPDGSAWTESHRYSVV